MPATSTLNLAHGLKYTDLFKSEGLTRLDEKFIEFLHQKNAELKQQLLDYRTDKLTNSAAISDFVIKCAPLLEAFLADLFSIQEELSISQIKTTSHNPIANFKKYFVLRRAKKEINRAKGLPEFDVINSWLQEQLQRSELASTDQELAVALLGNQYLQDAEKYKPEIEKLVQWCTLALTTPAGRASVSAWAAFKIPERIEHDNLVKTIPQVDDIFSRLSANPTDFRYRDGFQLTDPRMNAREVQDEINYCIYCHDHEGDFCSRGFPNKKGDPELGFKENPLGITLTGCPLEEKISEMHVLKRDGLTLAALSVVMIDNPMCPATGHRICNDCMKACIYQKQDPVNIPQIETRVLTDVLDLPWGVEIYDLLTRWNPLRQHQYYMKPYNGLKVMIAGMGPAGFTLAHHLLLEGFAVVGFDGLKIEPLPRELLQQPIKHFALLKETLDERLMAGFGGVAEYGITVRWDKNFLKLIYLSLARKPFFQVFGSARFGGTVTVEDAWELGFDHLAVAVGAGLPKALSIPNSLATGMRQANDFLMALQLGNAAKHSSLTNLQIRLPAVVIGGGLTGVDTATELQAYYISQVEKLYQRCNALREKYGEDFIYQQLNHKECEILNEYLHHGHQVLQERETAKKQRRVPDFIKLIRMWGGVTIVYRRSMQESPAYINNHEELQKALQEGIYYLEGLEPTSVLLDETAHCEALICHKRMRNQEGDWIATTEEVTLPAHSILVATGTQPNIAYEFEHKGTFNRLNFQYQHYEIEDGELNVAHGVEHCKDPEFGPFTSYQKHNQFVSLIGDTHPVFHGSVVKAIASGYRTYPKILQILQSKLSKVGEQDDYERFASRIQDLFTAKINEIRRISNDVIKLVIYAPMACKHFKPGQFYRLQNFETNSTVVNATLLQMEPFALVATSCDHERHLLTFFVVEDSTTGKICSTLKTGDPVALMGPTGVRAKVPNEHETVLIVGDRSSIPFTCSYGNALRDAHNRVLYLSILDTQDQLYAQDELEQAVDAAIWITKSQTSIQARRPHDFAITSDNLIQLLTEYGEGKFNHLPISIPFQDVDRIFVVGSAELLRQFQSARAMLQKNYFVKNPKVFGSVYGNMQCMLKGVCAQCLQWQIDPETGQRTKAVFACSWQDQPLEIIDIAHIEARREQNKLIEHVSNLWIDHLFATEKITRL